MDRWMDGQKDDGWTDGQMDGWADRWWMTDEGLQSWIPTWIMGGCVHAHVICMSTWMVDAWTDGPIHPETTLTGSFTSTPVSLDPSVSSKNFLPFQVHPSVHNPDSLPVSPPAEPSLL